jgi:hypothetical protein
MGNLKFVEELSVKLRSEKFLVIFKVETSEEVATEIVNRINKSLISEAYADKVLDPIDERIWWIRQEAENRRRSYELAEHINIIIKSFR